MGAVDWLLHEPLIRRGLVTLKQLLRTYGPLWLSVHSGLWLFDRGFDGAYVVAEARLGLVPGTAVMMTASFFVCWILLSFYDFVATLTTRTHYQRWLLCLLARARSRRVVRLLSDALGFETLKGAAEGIERSILAPRRPRIFIQSQWNRTLWEAFEDIPLAPLRFAIAVVSVLVATVETALLAVSPLIYPMRMLIYWLVRFAVAPLWRISQKIRTALTFVYLSCWHDPMTCTILMRSAYSHRMGKREWGIFLGSVLLSNATWGAMLWVGVTEIQKLIPSFWAILT